MMRQVTYAGRTFRTRNDVADALFEVLGALERGSSGESIELPAYSDDGTPQIVRLMIWPGSEIICLDESEDEAVADDAAATLLERAAGLRTLQRATIAHAIPEWPQMRGHDFDTDPRDEQ